MENFDITSFINMVDAFYNNAFNRLLLWGALLIAFLAIIMPILLQWLSQKYQSSEYIKMENDLRNKLTEMIEIKTKSMEENNRKIIKDELIPLEKKVHYSVGITFHNLGVSLFKEERKIEAMGCYIRATHEQIDADCEMDIKILLDNIEGAYSSTASTYENLFEFKNLKKDIEELISEIENKYGKAKYYDEIQKIRKAIDKKPLKFNKSKE